MKLYDLPPDMQEDIKKLASQHSITIDEVLDYYLMGGYKHTDKLCLLRDAGYTDAVVRLYNAYYWKEKNKNVWEELCKLSL